MDSGEDSTIRNFKVCIVHLIVRVIKYKRLRWVGRVARTEDGRGVFKTKTGKLQERDLYEGLGVDWRAILKWVLKK